MVVLVVLLCIRGAIDGGDGWGIMKIEYLISTIKERGVNDDER